MLGKKNNMSSNDDKFELIQHHASIRNFQTLSELPFVFHDNCYFTSQTTIEPSNHTTDLGVIVENNLSFKMHISDIVQRARNKLSWALSVFISRNVEVVLTLYKSLVRPIVDYCCVLWSPMKICEIAAIEGIQRTATSKISSLSSLNYWQRLKKLRLMSLQRRRERYAIIYMYKILHKLVPNDIGITFHDNPRRGIKAEVPSIPRFRSHLSSFDASFAVRGPALWNLLPKYVNTANSVATFKEKLDQFIMEYPDMPPVNGYTPPNSNSLSCWV